MTSASQRGLPVLHHAYGALRANIPGIAVALVIASATFFVSSTYGGPAMVLALLIGMALGFLHEDEKVAPGIRFCSKRLLRFGVALLGLKVAVSDVLALGSSTIEFLVAGVLCTIAIGIGTARLVGQSGYLGMLIGGATAICGASAALAISSVLPSRPHAEREAVFTVVSVTTLSTVAMVVYPALFTALGFSDQNIGVLLGATIHDVAQVVGAGYAVSDLTGDVATVVKLFRVALLLPIVFLISMACSRMETGTRKRSVPVPAFAIAFAVLVAINSLEVLPLAIVAPLRELSVWCLVMAVAAIGVSTSIREITTVGVRPVIIAVVSTIGLLLFSLGAVLLLP